MKKYILPALLAVAIISCGKSDTKQTADCSTVTTKAADAEIIALRTYLDTNNIVVTEDPRGFFYKVDTVTSGAKPTPCSNLQVAYTGYLLNGTSFDSSPNATFNLFGLIVGWKEALPLVTKGSTMTLYMPPSLGYGNTAVSTTNGTIPANSYMKFVILLKNVN